jgi:hypothetical protein
VEFAFFINPKHGLDMPGAAFFLAAALLFSACLLSTRIEKKSSLGGKISEPVPELIPPEGIASGSVATTSDT